VIVGVLAALLLAREARPQETRTSSLIVPGSKIRILAPTIVRGPLAGTVLQLDDESILISTDTGSALRVSRRALTQVEVGMGRRGNPKQGAFIGAAIGAVFGAVVGGSDTPEGPCLYDSTRICPATKGSAGKAVGLGAAMGVVGAGWGALIGHLHKHDVWAPVPLDAMRVSVAPAPGRGVGLTLSVSW
jgi:hypothetical protein